MSSPSVVGRRAVLQRLVQGGFAIALLPGTAAAGWRAVAAMPSGAAPRFLQPAQARLIGIVADAILPRTDTPGATDVGVVAWIDSVAADYFSEAQRLGFSGGIAAIDEHAVSVASARLESLSSGVVAGVLTGLDAACGMKNLTAAELGYVQLKELVIHGYFTSEQVQRDILEVPIVPGRFDPSVPVAPSDAK